MEAQSFCCFRQPSPISLPTQYIFFYPFLPVAAPTPSQDLLHRPFFVFWRVHGCSLCDIHMERYTPAITKECVFTLQRCMWPFQFRVLRTAPQFKKLEAVGLYQNVHLF